MTEEEILSKLREIENNSFVSPLVTPIILCLSCIPVVSIFAVMYLMSTSDALGKNRMLYGYYCGKLDALNGGSVGMQMAKGEK